MTVPETERVIRQRLRRGMLELDLILERFHREAFPALDTPSREAFARLLESEDDRLWEWLTGRAVPADPELADAVRRIRRHAGV